MDTEQTDPKTIVIFDALTGETVTREMTPEEIAELEAAQPTE